MTTTDRPKGGRRPEDFPDARVRDRSVINNLARAGMTRNQLAVALGVEHRPQLITYSLHRLRRRGLVAHVAKGCEGHGYWTLTLRAKKERET